jgi:hypothetical protein
MTDTWDFRRRASGIGRTRRTYIKAAQWFRAEYQILRSPGAQFDRVVRATRRTG